MSVRRRQPHGELEEAWPEHGSTTKRLAVAGTLSGEHYHLRSFVVWDITRLGKNSTRHAGTIHSLFSTQSLPLVGMGQWALRSRLWARSSRFRGKMAAAGSRYPGSRDAVEQGRRGALGPDATTASPSTWSSGPWYAAPRRASELARREPAPAALPLPISTWSSAPSLTQALK